VQISLSHVLNLGALWNFEAGMVIVSNGLNVISAVSYMGVSVALGVDLGISVGVSVSVDGAIVDGAMVVVVVFIFFFFIVIKKNYLKNINFYTQYIPQIKS
jgi:hypothetical protein